MPKPKPSINNNKNTNKSESINYFKFLSSDDNGNLNELDSVKLDNLEESTDKTDETNLNYINTKNEKLMKIYADDINFNNQEEDDNKGNWQSVANKKKKIMRVRQHKIINNDDFDFKVDIPASPNFSDDGSTYKLSQNWYIWTHPSESNNWTPESYKNIFTIDSIKSFWEFFGNIDKLDIIKHQFYIMRDSSGPTWEHPSNRSGGICSIRVIKDRSIEVIEQLAILVLNECFSDDPLDINGISFSIKHNWGVIKIWNKTGSHDLSLQLPGYMTKKYSANPRYEINEPEY